MPRLTRTRVILLVLASVVVLLAFYDVTIRHQYQVRAVFDIRFADTVPVRTAGVELFWEREQAEGAARRLNPDELEYPVRPPQPATVFARASAGHSGLGCRYTRFQQRYLAVVAVLTDGRRVGKVIELPDARESREVTVRLD